MVTESIIPEGAAVAAVMVPATSRSCPSSVHDAPETLATAVGPARVTGCADWVVGTATWSIPSLKRKATRNGRHRTPTIMTAVRRALRPGWPPHWPGSRSSAHRARAWAPEGRSPRPSSGRPLARAAVGPREPALRQPVGDPGRRRRAPGRSRPGRRGGGRPMRPGRPTSLATPPGGHGQLDLTLPAAPGVRAGHHDALLRAEREEPHGGHHIVVSDDWKNQLP